VLFLFHLFLFLPISFTSLSHLPRDFMALHDSSSISFFRDESK
jgi:hypothetical protein